jgi:hypothetical protein
MALLLKYPLSGFPNANLHSAMSQNIDTARLQTLSGQQ